MKPVTPVLPNRMDLETILVAENQPEYLTLPTVFLNDMEIAVTRWKLTWRERVRILISGNLWHSQLTFRQPMQPIRMEVEPPSEAR